MDAQTLATLVGALLTGGVATKLLEHLWPFLAGRGERRRSELDRAWASRDREAAKRRQLEEFASRCVRRLIEAPCVPDDTIPEWPASTPSTGPTDIPKGVK